MAYEVASTEIFNFHELCHTSFVNIYDFLFSDAKN